MFAHLRRLCAVSVLLFACLAVFSPLAMASLPLNRTMLSADQPVMEATFTSVLSSALLIGLTLAVGIVAAPAAAEPITRKRAKNTRKKERSSEDVPLTQPDAITMPSLHETLELKPDIIKVDGKDLHVTKDYLDTLAFNDERVEIMIHPPSDEQGSPTTELVSVGGIWAEVLLDSRGQFCTSKHDNGRMQPWGYLDRGVKFVTKRKYVEQLAKARHTTVRTEVTDRQSERPNNTIRRATNMKFPFQIFNDETPRAVEWLYRILR